MKAIPHETDALRLLEQVAQDVLGRAFKVSGLPRTDKLGQVAPLDLERLVEAAKQLLVMGPDWNRPDPV